jgi:hypothetical protein
VRRSEAWRRKSEVLRSFPGVGKVFCTTVLSKLPFPPFTSRLLKIADGIHLNRSRIESAPFQREEHR